MSKPLNGYFLTDADFQLWKRQQESLVSVSFEKPAEIVFIEEPTAYQAHLLAAPSFGLMVPPRIIEVSCEGPGCEWCQMGNHRQKRLAATVLCDGELKVLRSSPALWEKAKRLFRGYDPSRWSFQIQLGEGGEYKIGPAKQLDGELLQHLDSSMSLRRSRVQELLPAA